MAIDLNRADDFVKWLDWVEKRTTKAFLRDGFVQPTAYLVVTRDPNGDMFPEPIVAVVHPTRGSEEGGKDEFANAIRLAAVMSRAIGYVFTSEAWSLEIKVDIDTKAPRAEVHAAAKSIAEQHADKIKHHDDRVEILSLSSEHIALPNYEGPNRKARILRSGKTVRVTEWTKSGSSGGPSRFSGVLADAFQEPAWASGPER